MNVVTVTQLNTYIRALIDESPALKTVYVAGEISNFKLHRQSGHMYMTLKDSSSQLSAVMFASYARRLRFIPDDGMSVICRGRVSVFERNGAYQLYIEDMQPEGAGALAVAFEQLKNKLAELGLFSSEHKKSIPSFPTKIGVATSVTGAAIEDIKNILLRRFPPAELVIAPTIVQGPSAPGDIVKSLELLDSIDDIDVIIVGRGGGSLEDLWAFNTEEVAMAVYNCKKPVISAVGHETDYTICDFTADLRAETPSAAAEKAVPDINAVRELLSTSLQRIKNAAVSRLEREYQRLDAITAQSVLFNCDEYLQNKGDTLSNIESKITAAFEKSIVEKSHRLKADAGRLDALSPLAVISRGYAAVLKDKRAVRGSSSLKPGDKVKIIFGDGAADCTVNEVTENGNDI